MGHPTIPRPDRIGRAAHAVEVEVSLLLDATWHLSRPLLFQLDAERAHRFIVGSLGRAPRLAASLLGAAALSPPPALACRVGPLQLRSPIGLAAGLDKDGEAIPAWAALGFGFVEVGTVTAHAQDGNPQPRLFRLPAHRALINRMGFNNHGSAALATRLRQLREDDAWPDIPVGANIGKSKITPLDEAAEDYLTSVSLLDDLVDYLTVNVSSPNTPGLRELQQRERLAPLLEAVATRASVPVFVKLAPDLEEEALQEAVDVAVECGCAGIIATNTTNTRPVADPLCEEAGGFSGNPLWPLAHERVRQVIEAAASRVPVIGVGGVDSVERAHALLDLGCAAVQLYSALIFEGPGLISRLNRGLAESSGHAG